MTSWKQSANSLLSRTIGYRLQRAAPPGSMREQKVVDRLEAVAGRLEKAQVEFVGAVGKPAATQATSQFPDDYDDELCEVIRMVRPYTMTSPDKLHALITATRYLSRHDVAGAVVECGVWRGGSMHAVARTLNGFGDHSRDLYLFDTFEGMPPPTEKDVRMDGKTAQDLLAGSSKDKTIWAYATLEDVRAGFDTVPYPSERVHYVAGKVEDTIPSGAPESIALLRLDTDWYDSTRHELEHLYPRLVSGGILIIDDYGSWQGAKQATDEFLEQTGARLLMLRAGRGRIAVKP